MKEVDLVITICGSAKFRKEIDQAQIELTLAGHLVFTIENIDSSIMTDQVKAMLGQSHLKKIELSDAIYVINKDGYIGASAKNEISYAKELGKEILYME